MFTRLEPPVPLHVLDKGDGLAFGVIDYGLEHNLLWVTAIDNSGEIWCAPNPQVRMLANWSQGRAENALVANAKRAGHKETVAEGPQDHPGGVRDLCDDCATSGMGRLPL